MTIETLGNAEDTYLVEDSYNNYGVASDLSIGNWGDVYVRGLIGFEGVNYLPSGVTINSALLRLYCYSEQSSGNFNIAIHRSLNRLWEGEKDGEPVYSTDGSTNRRRNDNSSDPESWSGGLNSGGASGLDWAASATSQELIDAIDMWYEWDVKADIQDFVDGVHINMGWFMIGDEGSSNSGKGFHSEQFSTSNRRPELVINYGPTTPTLPAGVAGCCVPMDERGP